MAARAEVLNTGTSIDKRRAERLFYTAMSVAILITVFAGFSRTFFLRPYFQTQPLLPLLIAHGIIFSAWIVLFLTQTTLVAAKRTRIHMRLGIAGGLLASLMVVIGMYTAIVRAKGPSPIPDVNPLSFLTIPLGDMLLFGILVGAALYFRRRADTHKRLMLLSTIAILPAAVARLPIGFIQTGGPLVFFWPQRSFHPTAARLRHHHTRPAPSSDFDRWGANHHFAPAANGHRRHASVACLRHMAHAVDLIGLNGKGSGSATCVRLG